MSSIFKGCLKRFVKQPLIKTLSVLLALAVGSGTLSAHGPTPEEHVTEAAEGLFPINGSKLTPTPEVRALTDSADRLNAAGRLLRVEVEGSASPDGPQRLNERLARQRADALAAYLRSATEVPDSLVTLRYLGENWDALQQTCDRFLAPADAAAVREICAQHTTYDACEAALRRAQGGRLWKQLAAHVFPRLRYAGMRLHVRLPEIIVPEPEPQPEPEAPAAEEVAVVEEEILPAPAVPADEWRRHIYLKTNAPAWLCFWLNAAVEVDMAPHWTAQLPLYYSGFNYFRSDLKLRLFLLQPEVRWWPRSSNDGFFLGAHFGLAWYNCALEGDYRYQDHNGTTPALGGGLSAGVRFNFCRDRRWFMEISAGAGAYALDYDRFVNKPDGLLVDRRKRTFFGLDHFAVSFGYRFGTGKKGGEL